MAHRSTTASRPTEVIVGLRHTPRKMPFAQAVRASCRIINFRDPYAHLHWHGGYLRA